LPSRSPPIHDPNLIGAVPAGSPRPERAIDDPEVLRDGVPQALLEDDEAGADLVEHRRTLRPDLGGAPGRHHLAQQQRVDGLPLGGNQIGAVTGLECRRDAVVLLDQRAP
jgi:hypothetical protein